MTAHRYVQRLVARHVAPLAIRPRPVPRFASPTPALAIEVIDALGPRASAPRQELRDGSPGVDATEGREERREGRAEGSGAPETSAAPGRRRGRHDQFEFDLSRREGVADAAEGRHVIVNDIALTARAGLDHDDKAQTGSDGAGDQNTHATRDRGRHRDVQADARDLPHANAHDDDEREASSIPAWGGASSRARTRGDASESIHVHIGRIEVRAVTPPAERPSSPRRTAGPEPLSLDSYLARRTRQ